MEYKNENISNLGEYKRYRIFLWIFIILSVLSLIDIISRNYTSVDWSGAGFLTIILGLFFSSFEINFGIAEKHIFNFIFSLAPLWIVLMFVMNKKMKKLRPN